MPQLIFTRDASASFRIRLQGHSTKIGRSAQNDVVLPDSDVSREHAVLFAIEGQYFLKKAAGAMLRVNGVERESHPLRDGDRFELGAWQVLFQQQESEANDEETRHSTSESGGTQAVVAPTPVQSVKKLKLQVLEPSVEARWIALPSGAFLVGAAAGNDLVLKDPYVSSRHLKIVWQEGRIKVFDLGSTNGTLINGIRVGEAEVEPGTVMKVGHCQLILRLEEKSPEPGKMLGSFYGLVGSSTKMLDLFTVLRRVGPTEATALVLGESGTGKELVARALHDLSPRAKQPFVAINCGAISPELIESELFGHEKGAFTGAERRHEGAFGQARGGTLFLDEIGELPLELQPKLLRVLENRRYRRVGGAEEQTADTRIVAATHQNLATAVQEKRFREDLFFRLFVVPVYLPPLRERPEDLQLLTDHFLAEFSVSGVAKTLSPAARFKLSSAPWLGNVRELRNVLLRAVILSPTSCIESDEIIFPKDFADPTPVEPFRPLEKLEDMERQLVLRALAAHQWNKARTAEALGIAKSTLFSKIKLYGLQDPEANEGV